MKHLRQRFERFCLRNRNKGIPNLMLYIVLGNALVMLMSMMNEGTVLYDLLNFDKDLILQGQVWRLFTYVFTQRSGGFLELIFLYFFYMLGRSAENSMGTLKFNLFYLSGVILMDIFAMIFCPTVPEGQTITLEAYQYLVTVLPNYWNMSHYLHLSLILLFATTHPDSQFYILFVLPVRAWLIALIYLILVGVEVFNLSYPLMYFPPNLFPLVALANYWLFVGKDILNVLPFGLRMKLRNSKGRKAKQQPKVVPFPGARQAAHTAPDYNHRCQVCGRTDVSDPELEFRYCSRCTGYHCYCQDHINNHEHITE